MYERVGGLRYKYIYTERVCMLWCSSSSLRFGVCPTQRQVHSMKGSKVDGAIEAEDAPTEGCDREGCV
jgi:hypothetical protein